MTGRGRRVYQPYPGQPQELDLQQQQQQQGFYGAQGPYSQPQPQQPSFSQPAPFAQPPGYAQPPPPSFSQPPPTFAQPPPTFSAPPPTAYSAPPPVTPPPTLSQIPTQPPPTLASAPYSQPPSLYQAPSQAPPPSFPPTSSQLPPPAQPPPSPYSAPPPTSAPPPVSQPPQAQPPQQIAPAAPTAQPSRRQYAQKLDLEGSHGGDSLSEDFSSLSFQQQQQQQQQPRSGQPQLYGQQPHPQQQPQLYGGGYQQQQQQPQQPQLYGGYQQPQQPQQQQPQLYGGYQQQPQQPFQPAPGQYASPYQGQIQPPQSQQSLQPAELVKPLPQSQCPPKFMRMTINAIPNNSTLLTKSGLTLGLEVHPLAESDPNVPEEEIHVVNFGSTGIIRCRRCRAYINPFVQFTDAGRRWICNLCDLPNNVPNEYFAMIDMTGRRADLDKRLELTKGICEFVAPVEYMLKLAPQPPTYFFLIDVSYYAAASGMLTVLSETIRKTLEQIAGERTHVAFLTYDSTLHFYNLKSSLSQPQMLVVSDLNEVFIPLQEDMLVPLSESQHLVYSLIEKLPQMFKNTKVVDSALGPALKATYEIANAMGGKVLLFQCATPSLGLGKLANREDARLFGTEKENQLLNPDGQWYKELALEYSNKQMSVDLFLFASSQSTDLPSLAPLAQYTGGQTYFYPGMLNHEEDIQKFKKDLIRDLTRPHGFESVMRIRASKGVQMHSYYGNFFIRSSDLLSLPNIDADKSFGCKLAISENLANTRNISVQSALLYTTSTGERRIRVMTVCIPVTSVMADLFKHADLEATINLETRIAIERALTNKLSEGGEYLLNRCIEILSVYRTSFANSANTMQLILPNSMKLLPLYILALLKNLAFRTGKPGEAVIKPSERAFLLQTLRILPTTLSIPFIYPRLFCVAGPSVAPEYGEIGPDGRVAVPPVLNLSSEKLDRKGVFLLDNGQLLYLWIGKEVAPELLFALFGTNSLQGVNSAQLRLTLEDNQSQKVDRIISEIRSQRPTYQRLYIIKEGDPLEGRFFAYLVEDKHRELSSYYEFILQIHKQIQARK